MHAHRVDLLFSDEFFFFRWDFNRNPQCSCANASKRLIWFDSVCVDRLPSPSVRLAVLLDPFDIFKATWKQQNKTRERKKIPLFCLIGPPHGFALPFSLSDRLVSFPLYPINMFLYIIGFLLCSMHALCGFVNIGEKTHTIATKTTTTRKNAAHSLMWIRRTSLRRFDFFSYFIWSSSWLLLLFFLFCAFYFHYFFYIYILLFSIIVHLV